MPPRNSAKNPDFWGGTPRHEAEARCHRAPRPPKIRKILIFMGPWETLVTASHGASIIRVLGPRGPQNRIPRVLIRIFHEYKPWGCPGDLIHDDFRSRPGSRFNQFLRGGHLPQKNRDSQKSEGGTSPHSQCPRAEAIHKAYNDPTVSLRAYPQEFTP